MRADHRRVLDAYRFVAWAERELDRGAGTSRLDAPVVFVRRSHSLVAFRHSSDERNPADVTLDRKESWARSSALPASGCASSSATRSIVLEDGSCRSSAVEIRPGKGSATSEGAACDENTIA